SSDLEDTIPDPTTLRPFRERLARAGLIDQLEIARNDEERAQELLTEWKQERKDKRSFWITWGIIGASRLAAAAAFHRQARNHEKRHRALPPRRGELMRI